MNETAVGKPAWLEIAKHAGLAAALLYAAGFLSLRAWLNLLGVWTGPPLVDQVYLAEGAQFYVATAEKVLFPWMLLVVVLSLTGLITWVVIGRSNQSRLRQAAGRAIISSPQWLAPVLTLVTLLVLVRLISRVLLAPLEGPQSILLSSPRPELRPASDYQWAVGVVLLAAVVAFTVWRAIRLERGDALARWGALAILMFALFLLPMNFARIAKPRIAPVATIEGAEGLRKPITQSGLVFLLLTTDKEIVINDGQAVSTIDKARVHAIHVQCHASLLDKPACPRSTLPGGSVHDGRGIAGPESPSPSASR